MGSKAAAALFFLLNILLFSCVSSCETSCPPSTVPEKPVNCPKDSLKFGACSSWLGLVSEVVGVKPSSECCALIGGLGDLEAAVCICTALKGNALGIVKLKVPVALSLLVNGCGKKLPEGFSCT
ncbi:hypothetical protein Ancab_037174 [Ancistrocladus abbreviatus]